MKLSEKQREFTRMVAKFIQWATDAGFELTPGHLWRSSEEQARLYAAGLSKKKYSKHQDRLAIDFNLYACNRYIKDKEQYRPLGEMWESLGGRWGGRFGVNMRDYATKVGWDAGHFEYK